LPAGKFHAPPDRLEPVQPPRNHQVQYQPNPALHSDTNPLPQPPHLNNSLPVHARHRGRRRAQQERTHNPHMLEPQPYNPLIERLNVNRDVRQLRDFSHSWARRQILAATGRVPRRGQDKPRPAVPFWRRVCPTPSPGTPSNSPSLRLLPNSRPNNCP
jgi:hypothetical protein